MNDGEFGVDAFRAVLGEEAAARAGDHLEVETLVEYSEGSLAGDSEARVQDHLAGCRRCADRLLELEPLMRPVAVPADGAADFEVESAWRGLRARIGDGRTAAAVATWRRRAVALAASLTLVAPALGFWVARLGQANSALRLQVAELSAPVVNMPVLYLGGATRAASGPPERLELARETSRFALFFISPDLVPGREYEVELSSQPRVSAVVADRPIAPGGDAGGPISIQSSGLVMSESGGLRLGLTTSEVPAGDYRALVRQVGGPGTAPVIEHRFTIEYR